LKLAKSTRLISIGLLTLLLISITLVNSTANNKQPYYYSINSSTKVINNFSDFQILYNEPELSSVKSKSRIDFSYDGGSSEFYLMKYYYLPLINYGNCSNFEMQVTIDYDYTGSIYFGRFEFITGSYYNESGDYCGEPTGTVSGYPFAPAWALSKCNVVDAWSGFGGEFRVFAWPNDIGEKNITAHGVPEITGTATFHMNRNNNITYCQVKQSGTIMVEQTWASNVTKSLNFILIGEGIYAADTIFASASFYDFSATLEFTGTEEIGQHFNIIFLIGFTGILIILVIQRKFTRKFRK